MLDILLDAIQPNTYIPLKILSDLTELTITLHKATQDLEMVKHQVKEAIKTLSDSSLNIDLSISNNETKNKKIIQNIHMLCMIMMMSLVKLVVTTFLFLLLPVSKSFSEKKI